jgi:hypothetical protein
MMSRVRQWAGGEPRAATAAALAAVAFATGVTAVATWGDGSPQPWIWFSIVAAPFGVVGGIAAWSSTVARAALGVSVLVTAFWLLVFVSLLFFGDT